MSAWILIFFFTIYSVPCRSDNYVLRSNATANKCNINATIAFWCTVDSLLTNTEEALWYRKVGDTRQVLGQSAVTSIDFDGGRYKLSMTKRTQTSVTYELLISSIQLQDSATIQCVSPTSRQILSSNSLPVAVCGNTNSTFCNCIVAHGWTSPKCNEVVETSKNKRYESYRGVIGIAVCLAFMMAVALVLTILLISNEVKAHRKRKMDEEDEKIEIERNYQSKPSGPSILKKKNPEQNPRTSFQPRIDTFSMNQLQQVSFQGNASAPTHQDLSMSAQQNNLRPSKDISQAISDFTASNSEMHHKRKDVKQFHNFSSPQPTNENSESRI